MNQEGATAFWQVDRKSSTVASHRWGKEKKFTHKTFARNAEYKKKGQVTAEFWSLSIHVHNVRKLRSKRPCEEHHGNAPLINQRVHSHQCGFLFPFSSAEGRVQILRRLPQGKLQARAARHREFSSAYSSVCGSP